MVNDNNEEKEFELNEFFQQLICKCGEFNIPTFVIENYISQIRSIEKNNFWLVEKGAEDKNA